MTGTSTPFLDSYRYEDMDEFSQELTLVGTTGKLDWIVGAYYYDSESNYFGEFNFPLLTDIFKVIYGGAFGLEPDRFLHSRGWRAGLNLTVGETILISCSWMMRFTKKLSRGQFMRKALTVFRTP